MIKSAKIYVAGHRGLVGSAICKKLTEQGYTNLVTKTHAELDLLNQQQVNSFFDKEKPDYVFIAGDLTLFASKPSKAELKNYLLPLKNLKAQTYVILGNHDLQVPGPDLADDLVHVLSELGMQVLNNDRVELDGFTLV